jgi:predicted N-formylglutamate amidohydrolase
MAEPTSSSPATLLADDDPAVFELVRPGASSAWLLTCDHAGRAIPRRLKRLGLTEPELNTHVAWDLGVAELGRRLSERLDAVLILQNYSRLVIDANRPLGASDSIPVLSERTSIPANEGLSSAQIRQRVEEVFQPYHRRLAEELDQRAARGRPSVVVALHSFTPTYLGEERPWQVGVLYGRDARLGRLMHSQLCRDPALVVGDNQPYAAGDASDYTIIVHGEQRAIPHVELEVRQDLLSNDAGLWAWTELLARALEACLPGVLACGAGSLD